MKRRSIVQAILALFAAPACAKFIRGARTADTTAPTLTSAAVADSTPGRIDLTWSEAINATVSAHTAFAVSAGHTLTAHAYVDATHSYLTTSTDFVNGESARTLAYTQPGSNNMQDLAGNLLANFSGTAITNNVQAGGGALTMALTVEYVDASGVLQRTSVVDGVTTISGVAPFLVHFDASETRTTEATGDDEEGAVRRIGYRFDYGEALGGPWAYGTKNTKDVDIGGPLAGRVYTTTGTKTARVKGKDSANNESTISVIVVVAASSTLTTVHIPVSDGAWPTFVSSRRYTLDRGGNYSSFGSINCDTLHNIVFEAVGSGAFPIVANFQPESRRFLGDSGKSSSTSRARNIRAWNIDTAHFLVQQMGFDYCAVVGGRARAVDLSFAYAFWYADRVANNAAHVPYVRYSRGAFLWDCGEVNNANAEDDAYLLICDGIRAFHAKNVFFNKATAGNRREHNIRGVYDHSTFTNCCVSNATQIKSWFKFQGQISVHPTLPPDWRSDDRVGDDSGTMYGYADNMCFTDDFQMGVSGHSVPDQPAGHGPQNNDIETQDDDEGSRLGGFEDILIFGDPTFPLGESFNYTGLNLWHRNVRRDMGAGAAIPMATGAGFNKAPAGWNTGYLDEATTNTRPVPSAF